jgi:integrase
MLSVKALWKQDLRSAGFYSLKKLFGGGHFSTMSTYRQRWTMFVNFTAQQGVHNLHSVSLALVMEYVHHLADSVKAGDLAVSTAVNRLSCCNVVFRSLLGNDRFYVGPGDFLPQRRYVRTKIPGGLDRSRIIQAIDQLSAAGHHECAIMVFSWRFVGMRFKEAILQDYQRLQKNINDHGKINIREGTKNGRGRYIDRWVPVDSFIATQIEKASTLQGSRPNLMPVRPVTYIQTTRRVRRQYDQSRKKINLPHPHDLRAAYSCDRYFALTGFQAPVITGKRLASKDIDRAARKIISHELGHSRPSVCISYLGSAR